MGHWSLPVLFSCRVGVQPPSARRPAACHRGDARARGGRMKLRLAVRFVAVGIIVALVLLHSAVHLFQTDQPPPAGWRPRRPTMSWRCRPRRRRPSAVLRLRRAEHRTAARHRGAFARADFQVPASATVSGGAPGFGCWHRMNPPCVCSHPHPVSWTGWSHQRHEEWVPIRSGMGTGWSSRFGVHTSIRLRRASRCGKHGNRSPQVLFVHRPYLPGWCRA